MTPDRLRNIATYYCRRYLTSEAKLRNYLETRLYREMEGRDEREAMAQHIPEIAANLVRIGLVNDAEVASAKLRSALRAGYAKSAAVNNAARAARVDRKAVEAELPRALEDIVPEIVEEASDAGEEAVMLAGLALRRARRGPFRTVGGDDEALQRRDTNWLRRRGFRYDDIQKAMRLDGDEA